MSIKKYTNGSWTPASRKYGTETDTITTLPATIIGDGTPITSYTVKGNMEQNGTPTPSSPIYPSECGERTENLFDLSFYYEVSSPISDIVIEKNSITYNAKSQYLAIKYKFNLGIADVYTISLGGDSLNTVLELRYGKNGEYVGKAIIVNPNQEITVRGGNEYDKLYIYISNGANTGTCTASNIMLNSGSTALPYEPYGYKLPLTLGSTTTNIYLGEVQSTRTIKKLVLTGEEDWKAYQTSYYITVNNYYRAYDVGSHISACSHYPNAQIQSLPEKHYSLGGLIDGETNTRWNGNIVFNSSPMISSKTDWISYLAAQYAAGTPVTVWYVLAEPETAVVNEPIRKIGDYVDSVSGTGLTTSGTAQGFDINTTLKPSEVDMTYHGWHEHEDTKFTT